MPGLVAPLWPQSEPRASLPGVEVTAARDLLGARGTDMRRCGAAARWAAWAQGSPGNNDRAGTRRRGRTGTGHRSLRRLLVPWAWSARNTPTVLGRPFRRLAARSGGKKAAVAVGPKLWGLVAQRRGQGPFYEEPRYAAQRPHQEDYTRKRARHVLERLG